MDMDVKDSLEDLGYSGPLRDEAALNKAIEEGSKSAEFTQLVAWLSHELQTLGNLESCINAETDAEDSMSFMIEVSSFLKELQCPYQCLLEGPLSQRFDNKKNRIILLDYLCSELQAARIIQVKSDKRNELDIEMEASGTASDLTELCDSLDLNVKVENPSNIILEAEEKVKQQLLSSHLVLPKPLFDEELTEDQWDSLHELQKELHEDYQTRREMLLTRLDVTIQSFKWGESSKGKEDEIAKAFVPRRQALKIEPNVDISDLLAAREDLLIIEKTSSADQVKNTKSALNKIIIPAVPDRGGRPSEQRAPAAEMPSWQKRSSGNPSGPFQGGDKGHQKWGAEGKKFKDGGGYHKGGGGGGRGRGGGNYRGKRKDSW